MSNRALVFATLQYAAKVSGALLIVLLVAIGLPGCDAKHGDAVTPADPLSQSGGEWLFINYWAEWCKPCIEEIPHLNTFAAKHASEARVLLVNFDGLRGAQLRAAANKLDIRTGLLESDPAARLGLQTPQALPATYVISPDGKLAHALLGPQTVDSLEAAMQPGPAAQP